MPIFRRWGRMLHLASFFLALAIIPLIICGCASSGDRDLSDLSSIVINPSSATIAKDLSVKMTALGIDRDGVASDITSLATWSSSDNSIATVKGGIVTGISAGTVDIVAKLGNISSQTAKVTITDSTIEKIEIIGEDEQVITKLSLIDGTQKQLKVKAYIGDGTTADITDTLIWSSSDVNIATVSNTGLVSGKTPGEAKIIGRSQTTAKSSTSTEEAGEILVELPVIVTEAQVVEVTIKDNDSKDIDSLELALGFSYPLSATAKYENGLVEDVTMSATWDSSDKSIALVELSSFLQKAKVTSISEGTSDITAEFDGKTATCQVKITPAEIASLKFDQGPTASMVIGDTTDLSTTGDLTDGSTSDVTDLVEFSTSDPTIAIVESAGTTTTAGRVHALKAGNVTITATSKNGVEATIDITISDKITSITIVPDPNFDLDNLRIGYIIEFTAIANYDNGIKDRDVTNIATWTSSNPNVAIVNKGTVHADGYGSATITASLDGLDATSTINVIDVPLLGIKISPDSYTIPLEQELILSAMAMYGDGQEADVSKMAKWTSSDTTVATVTDGKVSPLKIGDVIIRITFQGMNAESYITVK